MKKVRVRFAPSPTGALHIGGVRTALYNYLFAKKHGGTFILRIEDTDQFRYVQGAEDYIMEALNWCNLTLDEGPQQGGDFAPYRQSERKDMYQQYAQQLIERGHAYYAFDTSEELDAKRQEEKEKGNHTFKYGSRMRMVMKNSLTMPEEEVEKLISSGVPYTVRLKVPEDEIIAVHDLIRGEVKFQSKELDDKVILKGDGLPTYHLANIVDDHLMEISHVIRGEEWLPSTAHHVLLYRFLGWEDEMPQFAHLPLILKPSGKGKLSKRDGSKLGIPVFPLSWKEEKPEDSFAGFREYGFDPRAVLNFLAFLGWNPGTEQEIFSLDELCQTFSLEHIGKSGARFDYDKAKWFNQQYIMATDNQVLAENIKPMIRSFGHEPDDAFLEKFCNLYKERVTLYPDFWEMGYYFFEPIRSFDQKPVRKKWKAERREQFDSLAKSINELESFEAENLEQTIKGFINDQGLKFGDVLPVLRVAVSGTTKGPDLFPMMALLGKEKVNQRLLDGFNEFDSWLKAAEVN